MALTKIEHDEILKKIAETGGATDDMLDEIKKLRDDYDEREGMLKRDGEKSDEAGGEKWKEKYDELHKKYIDRFFASPEEAKKEMNNAIADNKSDTKKDDKSGSLTFEELFTEREGN